MNAVPEITLNNDVRIPQLGYGLWQVDPAEAAEATLQALKAGYRHLDTAEMYGNEKQVGEAVRRSGIPREQIFVTSKLNNGFHAHADALAAFDRTLEDLGFDYLDLFLIHWPMPATGDYLDTWRAMAEIYRSGRVKAVGVSNFQRHHLQRLLDETDLVPAVNQIEVHPYLTQDALRAFDTEHGIANQAWSPLAQGRVFNDPALSAVAERVGRPTSQVVLRWHIQRGDIVFPKSVTPARIRENLDLFDFELSAQDMAAISALNRDERIGPDPDTFNWIP